MNILSRILGFFRRRSAPVIILPSTSPLSTDPNKPIRLIGDDSCSMAELTELVDIEISLNRTLMSEGFEDFIIRTGRIDLMNGRTRSEIIEDMRAPINLTIHYYEDENTQVDGYENNSTPGVVYINRLAMAANKFSNCDKCGLILHERSHCAGYYHISNYARPNYYTVPFLMTRSCVSKLIDPSAGGCCT